VKAKLHPKARASGARKPTPEPTPRRDLLALAERGLPVVLLLLGLAIYWPSLWGPFVFDDIDILEPRSSVRLESWRAILNGPRPLLISSYALNYRLAGGQFRSFDFRLVNVLFHIVNSIILWRLMRRLARALEPAARRLVVLGVPLLFLASPIQTESVAYISSRSELMAAAFYLLALLVFASEWGDRRPHWAAPPVAVLCALAVLSKQHAVTLPAAVLLADYFFLAGGDWRRLKRHWLAYALFAAGAVAAYFLIIRPVLNAPSAGFSLRDVSPKEYLFTQFRMYFLYLRLLAAPFGLNVDYDIPLSRTLFEHGAWLGLAGILALLAAALWVGRRRPLVGFGALFFVLTLLPTSSFYPLLDYAAERRLYLPSIGFFVAALGLGLARWPGRRALPAAVGVVVAVYAAGTFARSQVWADALTLWQDTTVKSPNKWRPYTWLGREYSDRKMFGQAGEAYQRAAALAPQKSNEHADVLSSLGSTYANRGMYTQAVEIYRQALQIAPGISTLWTNLAIAEVRLGRPEGWALFEKALELNPLAWEPHFARGNLYYQLGRYEDAIRDYERVLNLLPDHADAQYNLNAARAMKQRMGR